MPKEPKRINIGKHKAIISHLKPRNGLEVLERLKNVLIDPVYEIVNDKSIINGSSSKIEFTIDKIIPIFRKLIKNLDAETVFYLSEKFGQVTQIVVKDGAKEKLILFDEGMQEHIFIGEYHLCFHWLYECIFYEYENFFKGMVGNRLIKLSTES